MTTLIRDNIEEKKSEKVHGKVISQHSDANHDVLLLAFFALLESANVCLQSAQTDAKSLLASQSIQAQVQRNLNNIRYSVIAQGSQKQQCWRIHGKNTEMNTSMVWTVNTPPVISRDYVGGSWVNGYRYNDSHYYYTKNCTIKEFTKVIPLNPSVYQAADNHNLVIQKDLSYLSGQLMGLQMGQKSGMAGESTDTNSAAMVIKQGLECLSALANVALTIGQMHAPTQRSN